MRCAALAGALVAFGIGAEASASGQATPQEIASTRALSVTPAATAPTEAQGDLLLQRGRYLAAIQVLQAVEPKTAVLYNKLGIASEHMLMFTQARSSFEQALRLDPKYADAYNNLGTVFHSQKDFRQAEKLYKKAIHLRPDNADTYQNLGTLYYGRGKFRKGDEAYKRALALDRTVVERSAHNAIQAAGDGKSTFEAHYHLAKTYAEAGSHELALQFLRKSILEGFHDRKRLLHEEAFADLRTSPVFLKMVDDLRTN